MSIAKRLIGPVTAVGDTITVLDAFHTVPHPTALPRLAGQDVAVGDWVEVSGGQLRLLARSGSALARIYALAVDKAFDPIHPDPVREEAAALHRQPGIDAADLVDRTDLPFVTIDEVHSKDLDQALCIQRGADGGWLVWYAIADAAWFARPGQPLFDEALRRGATCYLPGLVVPMMPAVLSEDACSLNPRVDRRALLFRMALDDDGARRGCTIERARIRSRAKLDYDGVDAWLKGDGALLLDDPAVEDSLRALQAVGELRIQQAAERDVVRLRRVESAVRMEGADGLRFVAFSDPRNDVERYNEQISLLCNMEGAAFLMHDAPDFLQPIFRVHPAPSAGRLAAMREQVEGIVSANQLGTDWLWDHGAETLAAYLDRLPRDGAAGRVARAIHRQAMMINGRSSFTGIPGLHHGVGAEAYARFSAPMREIVGIFVHLQCWEKLRGAPLPGRSSQDDEALREAVIAASNAARSRQRDLDHETNRLVIDQIFAEDARHDSPPWRRGTIMGITKSKVHVQLDDIGIDVKVYRHHLEKLLGCSLRAVDRTSMRASEAGTFQVQVGQAVDLQVVERDRGSDRWVLSLRR